MSGPLLSVAGITVWGPDWLRLIEIPAGAWEKSSPAMLPSGGSYNRLAAARVAVEGERVIAAAAHQRVVARAPHQRVGAARADQGVVAGSALKDGAPREARGVEREVAGAGRQDRVLEAAQGRDRRGRAPARGRQGRCR